MSGRRISHPAGSSNKLRGDVLRVLGVVKIATADQIQRLTAPHLTYRHTGKPTAAERKEARTRAHRAAARDLQRQRLVAAAGRSRGGEVLWALTAAGLQAAAQELHRPASVMGAPAARAGASGAPHALAVNETILALTRPAPDLELLTGEPPAAVAAARAARPGIGALEQWATEVPLPLTGAAWSKAGPGGIQADAVLAAPEHGVPVLFVEVDTCHMDAQRLADKIGKYTAFLRRRTEARRGRPARPLWRTRWPAPPDPYGTELLPPLLLVFHPHGPRNPDTTAALVAERTRIHWQGRPAGSYTDYDGKLPVIATTIGQLRDAGPGGAVFHRFGRDRLQCLADALGNPRQAAAEARREARSEAQRQEEARLRAQREAAEREARRPVCTDCGQKLTDARQAWAASRDGRRDPHRELCENCAQTARARAAADRQQQQEEEAAAAAVRRRLFRRRA
ncbi:replication-relaxation family protein [Streptomyces aidingensis]|uniref:Replication-relaxation n=1 Tax=Streptomyces aidingensis TaxID=910347 RepID=A0A1I1UW46_9ACTN|nr:replication-relaxation family protein [Streptomyces aidingensis]SFD75017.1 Replication-relaxation [Streptomyces aidingensis]